MAQNENYSQVNLIVGTEAQFNAKVDTLPAGTLFGITDATVSKADLSTDLKNEINGKLNKPTTPSSESAVTMLADGTVGTKPLSEIGGGVTLYRHDLRITRTATSSVPGFGYSVYCSFYSSSNLNITSVANLRTVLGNQFTLMATGYLSGTDANYDPVEAIFQSGVRPIKNTDQTYDNATFSDEVTKII